MSSKCLKGWLHTYLAKSENMSMFRNAWGGVVNGLGLELGVGALGGGAFLFLVKKWMTSSDSRHKKKTSSISSKNRGWWCQKNWRKGKRYARVWNHPTSETPSQDLYIFLTSHTDALPFFNPSPFLPLHRLSLQSSPASIPALIRFCVWAGRGG